MFHVITKVLMQWGKMQERFVGFERDTVIAEDVCETLKSKLPGCEVRIARSLAHVRGMLGSMDRLDALLMAMSRVDYDASGLESEIARLGARVMLLHDSAGSSVREEGAVIRVPRPYTSSMLGRAIAYALPQRQP